MQRGKVLGCAQFARNIISSRDVEGIRCAGSVSVRPLSENRLKLIGINTRRNDLLEHLRTPAYNAKKAYARANCAFSND
jgi:hypothetical protein